MDDQHYDPRSSAPSPGYDLDTLVKVTLWGITGNNGLVGTTRQLRQDVDVLQRFQSDVMLLWAVVRWSLLVVGAILTALSADTISAIIADLVGKR